MCIFRTSNFRPISHHCLMPPHPCRPRAGQDRPASSHTLYPQLSCQAQQPSRAIRHGSRGRGLRRRARRQRRRRTLPPALVVRGAVAECDTSGRGLRGAVACRQAAVSARRRALCGEGPHARGRLPGPRRHPVPEVRSSPRSCHSPHACSRASCRCLGVFRSSRVSTPLMS